MGDTWVVAGDNVRVALWLIYFLRMHAAWGFGLAGHAFAAARL